MAIGRGPVNGDDGTDAVMHRRAEPATEDPASSLADAGPYQRPGATGGEHVGTGPEDVGWEDYDELGAGD